MAKKTAKTKSVRRRPLKAKIVKHPAKPHTMLKSKSKPRRGAKELPDAEQFETIQVKDVPAEEVESLIAEERATAKLVSVQKHRQTDGKFTVVFVYRTS